MSDAPAYTVAVPAYNQSALLLRLLESFDLLECPETFEVLVVDDCSTDDTEAVVQEWLARPRSYEARYIRMDQNRGPGAARSRAAREGRGRIIAYTDSDCIVAPDWLAMLVRKVDEEKRIVGTGGRVIALSDGSAPARYLVFNAILEPPKLQNYLVTCNCCYLRTPLVDAGAFPEDIPTPGGEDVAASIALWKQGWRFAYEPDAVIQHDFRENLRKFVRTWRNYGFGCGLVAHRMLDKRELYPEMGEDGIENYWRGDYIRPNVTGIRSFRYRFVWHWRESRKAGHSFYRSCETLTLWFIERMAYLHGWKQGRGLAKQERAQQR